MLTLLLPEHHYYTNTLDGPCNDVIYMTSLHLCGYVGVVRLWCMRMRAFLWLDVMPCAKVDVYMCGRPDDTHAGACSCTMIVGGAQDYRATDRE